MEVRYRGIHLLNMPAYDVVRYLSREAQPCWAEYGNAVTFYDLDIAFWRTATQSEVGDESEGYERHDPTYWGHLGSSATRILSRG